MKISRVTQSGNATNVAISPDGRYVVYALREGEKQSLNVRQVATGSDVQILPPDEVVIWSLTFSPDANYIDFVRSEKPDFTRHPSLSDARARRNTTPCDAGRYRLRIQLLSRWYGSSLFCGQTRVLERSMS